MAPLVCDFVVTAVDANLVAANATGVLQVPAGACPVHACCGCQLERAGNALTVDACRHVLGGVWRGGRGRGAARAPAARGYRWRCSRRGATHFPGRVWYPPASEYVRQPVCPWLRALTTHTHTHTNPHPANPPAHPHPLPYQTRTPCRAQIDPLPPVCPSGGRALRPQYLPTAAPAAACAARRVRGLGNGACCAVGAPGQGTGRRCHRPSPRLAGTPTCLSQRWRYPAHTR